MNQKNFELTIDPNTMSCPILSFGRRHDDKMAYKRNQ